MREFDRISMGWGKFMRNIKHIKQFKIFSLYRKGGSVIPFLSRPPLTLLQHLVGLARYNQCWNIPHNFPVCRHLLIALNSSYLTRCDERLGWVPSPPTGYCPSPQSEPGFLSLHFTVQLRAHPTHQFQVELPAELGYFSEVRERERSSVREISRQTSAKVNRLE